VGFADRKRGQALTSESPRWLAKSAAKPKGNANSAKGQALDRVLKTSHNLPSLLITDRQRVESKSLTTCSLKINSR
jgi:hypothetical protein